MICQTNSKTVHCRIRQWACGLICPQAVQFCFQQTVLNKKFGVSQFTSDLASYSFYVNDFLTIVSLSPQVTYGV